jgi:hypothetical protein
MAGGTMTAMQERTHPLRDMKGRIAWIVVALLLIGAAAAIYFLRPFEPRRPALPQSAAPTAPAPPATGPRFPLPLVAPEEKPLPSLKESDPAILEALVGVIGPQALANFIQPETLVRHIVVTIDNLPRQTFAPQMSPVRLPGGQLRTTGKGDSLAIGPENYARYTPYVRLAESVETAKLFALYQRFYPLFQQAYVDLGFPGKYFNDRLVEVIDHLLDTPEVKGPIQLVVPHVLPEFADPALQERSAGQKMLLRMGPENAARVKAKLREIRAAVAKQ